MTPADRFEVLFEKHHRAVLGYVARRVDHPADAADIVAEVFIVVWRKLPRVPASELPWLLGVARNLVRNHRRGRTRQLALTERLVASLTFAPAPDPGTVAIMAAVNLLPEGDRDLVLLTAWEGLTPSEAGAVIGLKGPAARVRLHRARARLRLLLDEHAPVGENADKEGLPAARIPINGAG